MVPDPPEAGGEVRDGFRQEFLRLGRERDRAAVCRTVEVEAAYPDGVFRDPVGFAGCRMIRRTVGLAQVSDLTGPAGPYGRLRAQSAALLIGQDLSRAGKSPVTPRDLRGLIRGGLALAASPVYREEER